MTMRELTRCTHQARAVLGSGHHGARASEAPDAVDLMVEAPR